MGNATLSTFLFGLIVSCLFVAGTITFMSNMGESYGVTYDNSSFGVYDKMTELNSISAQARGDYEAATTEKSDYDIFGLLVAQGKSAVTTVMSSLDVAYELLRVGTANLGLGEYYTGFGAMLGLFLFVTIGFHILTKSERI